MSEIQANIVLQPIDSTLVVQNNQIDFTPASIQLRLFNSGSRGDQGPIGYTGSQGPPDGYTGSQGAIGYTGSQGPPDGYTGSRGFIGSRGFTGSRGYDGSLGGQGPIGFTGSRGYTGSVGFVGSLGSQGPIGFVGSRGFTGSLGPQGPIGFTGSVGMNAGFQYYYDNTLTPGAGSNGSLRFNSVNYFSITEIYINRYTTGGLDLFGAWSIGDNIYIYSNVTSDAATFRINNITGTAPFPYYTLSVTWINGVMPPGWPSPINNSGLSVVLIPNGYIGSQGFTGSQGAGFTGSQGATGFIGSQGPPNGYTGSKGDIGYTGSAGANATKTAIVQYLNSSTTPIYNASTNTTVLLNNVAFDNIGATLNNNQITLPPGVYSVDGSFSWSFFHTHPTNVFTEVRYLPYLDIRSNTGTIYIPTTTNYVSYLARGSQTWLTPVLIKGVFTITNTSTVIGNFNWTVSATVGTINGLAQNVTPNSIHTILTFTQLYG